MTSFGAVSFRPIEDPGVSDAAYSVLTDNFGGPVLLGTVLRFGRVWLAASPAGDVVASGRTRDEAAAALDRVEP